MRCGCAPDEMVETSPLDACALVSLRPLAGAAVFAVAIKAQHNQYTTCVRVHAISSTSSSVVVDINWKWALVRKLGRTARFAPAAAVAGISSCNEILLTRALAGGGAQRVNIYVASILSRSARHVMGSIICSHMLFADCPQMFMRACGVRVMCVDIIAIIIV